MSDIHWEPGRKVIDCRGQRFGRLVVVSYDPRSKGSGRAKWLCRCDCGRSAIVVWHSLRQGYTTSCGCVAREVNRVKGRHLSSPEMVAKRVRKRSVFATAPDGVLDDGE